MLRRAIRTAVLGAALISLTGCGIVKSLAESLKHPARPFDVKIAPPAPDYAKADAWMAFPGRGGPRGGMERSTTPGVTPIVEADAPADVFFIHPTTYLKNDVWNARYDASNREAPYNAPVLLAQISVFNGCCRAFAPQYRQASLYALDHSRAADELAYSDVARAFRWYIAHENNGRPFIIASHSQGSMHALRLLQDEILGTPLQKQLVAAYVVGAYAPEDFGTLGLPVCASGRQTGCIVSWNTSQAGKTGAFMLIHNKTYWWRGGWKTGGPAAICINPLTWTATNSAPASANAGSLGFPHPPFPTGAVTLPALTAHLTGAVCKDRLLYVDIDRSAPKGYHDSLSLLYGSYHVGDYGIFYSAVRTNAGDRVSAWTAAQHRAAAAP
jgi:hypothetical protein